MSVLPAVVQAIVNSCPWPQERAGCAGRSGKKVQVGAAQLSGPGPGEDALA